MMTSIITNKKAELSALAELISEQYADADCCSALRFVRKPNTHCNIDSNIVLITVFPLGGASQGVMPASLHPVSFTNFIITFLPVILANVECTNP